VSIKTKNLSKKIDEYLENKYSQFHSPAHCGYLNKRDLSEVEGLDDLQEPAGVLKEAQEACAKLFGAAESFFLVNGASVGMQVSCIALKLYLEEKKDARPVLIARNVHKSVIAGIILAGLHIEWLEPEWNSELGVYSVIASAALQSSHINNYSALIITNPTYEGFYSELSLRGDGGDAAISQPVFIIDEAHGAHYHFSDKLPKPALDYGADIVVQSWHKTLGSLTQTGVLHQSKDSKIPAKYIKAALNLLQTTSPSYLLLESLTKVTEKYSSEGKEIIKKNIIRADSLRQYRVSNDDPCRYIIQVPGYSGEELDQYLLENKISVEEVLETSVLAFINPGNSDEDIERLRLALEKIPVREVKGEGVKGKERMAPSCKQQRINPRDAFFKEQDIGIEAPCPPGIAKKVPGQCLPE